MCILNIACVVAEGIDRTGGLVNFFFLFDVAVIIIVMTTN